MARTKQTARKPTQWNVPRKDAGVGNIGKPARAGHMQPPSLMEVDIDDDEEEYDQGDLLGALQEALSDQPGQFSFALGGAASTLPPCPGLVVKGQRFSLPLNEVFKCVG
jgi:hypothetical protein